MAIAPIAGSGPIITTNALLYKANPKMYTLYPSTPVVKKDAGISMAEIKKGVGLGVNIAVTKAVTGQNKVTKYEGSNLETVMETLPSVANNFMPMMGLLVAGILGLALLTGGRR